MAQMTASHAPEARRKARAAMKRLTAQRLALAQKYGVKSSDFQKSKLRATMQRHGIPLSEIMSLFPTHGALTQAQQRELAQLELARATSGNGKDRGVGIPLDAIPAKAERKGGSGVYERKSPRTHPNAELIGKIIDVLASPQTSDTVAQRLLSVLDKLTQ